MADTLLQILDLDPDPADIRQCREATGTADATGPTAVFTGRSLRYPANRVFGGQILAQSVIAADRTVATPAVIHSLHGYFLLPGDPLAPIRFAVYRLRDGRSFHARRVDATQGGQLIAAVLASFQLPAAGPEHQDQAPLQPSPEDLQPRLPSAASPGRAAPAASVLPVELRPVPFAHLAVPGAGPLPTAATWLRVTAALADSAPLHAALLALLSDFSILRPALRAHGFAADRSRVKTASIDHSLWFHRPCRADEWILYHITSPSAGGGRASGSGRMFSADGKLVASAAQEGMFRVVG